MKKTWTEEQKKEFWAAFCAHRREGCRIREAFRLAHGDFERAGKEAPSQATFANWYRKAMMRPEDAAPEQTAEPAEPAGSPASAPSDPSDKSDYTRRLELMVRLYRTHSEDARDALCDYLLPELNEE